MSNLCTTTTEPSSLPTPGSQGQVKSLLAAWLLIIATGAISVSLLWDYSWECTIGVDHLWSPPHLATDFSVLLAGIVGVMELIRATFAMNGLAVRLGGIKAPLGIWIVLWGVTCFATAFLFDRWWQSAYGLAAGIWHPPQMLKTAAFFAIALGAWVYSAPWENTSRAIIGGNLFLAGAGLVLVLTGVVTLVSNYPNRQHTAWFFKICCATYPIVLLATRACGGKFASTRAAAVYMLLFCGVIWILPLFPGKPQAAPVYNMLEHMLPPPFPLLLVIPALALDLLLSWLESAYANATRPSALKISVMAGVLFAVVFIAFQWALAEFLLSSLADNWFFAGGGRHFPFFLKIDALARTEFWEKQGELNLLQCVYGLGLAVLASRFGLALGVWLKGVRA